LPPHATIPQIYSIKFTRLFNYFNACQLVPLTIVLVRFYVQAQPEASYKVGGAGGVYGPPRI